MDKQKAQQYLGKLKTLLQGKNLKLLIIIGATVLLVGSVGGMLLVKSKTVPEQVMASTVSPNGFTVSAFTDWKAATELVVADNPEFKNSREFQDERDYLRNSLTDEQSNRNSHVLVARGLEPDTQYWYKVRTSFNSTFDEELYTLKTPAVSEDIPSPEPIYGEVVNQEGNPQPNILIEVYAEQADGRRSASIVTYTAENGTYSADLANLRTLAHGEYWKDDELVPTKVKVIAKSNSESYFYDVYNKEYAPVPTFAFKEIENEYAQVHSPLPTQNSSLLSKLAPEAQAEEQFGCAKGVNEGAICGSDCNGDDPNDSDWVTSGTCKGDVCQGAKSCSEVGGNSKPGSNSDAAPKNDGKRNDAKCKEADEAERNCAAAGDACNWQEAIKNLRNEGNCGESTAFTQEQACFILHQEFDNYMKNNEADPCEARNHAIDEAAKRTEGKKCAGYEVKCNPGEQEPRGNASDGGGQCDGKDGANHYKCTADGVATSCNNASGSLGTHKWCTGLCGNGEACVNAISSGKNYHGVPAQGAPNGGGSAPKPAPQRPNTSDQWCVVEDNVCYETMNGDKISSSRRPNMACSSSTGNCTAVHKELVDTNNGGNLQFQDNWLQGGYNCRYAGSGECAPSDFQGSYCFGDALTPGTMCFCDGIISATGPDGKTFTYGKARVDSVTRDGQYLCGASCTSSDFTDNIKTAPECNNPYRCPPPGDDPVTPGDDPPPGGERDCSNINSDCETLRQAISQLNSVAGEEGCYVYDGTGDEIFEGSDDIGRLVGILQDERRRLECDDKLSCNRVDQKCGEGVGQCCDGLTCASDTGLCISESGEDDEYLPRCETSSCSDLLSNDYKCKVGGSTSAVSKCCPQGQRYYQNTCLPEDIPVCLTTRGLDRAKCTPYQGGAVPAGQVRCLSFRTVGGGYDNDTIVVCPRKADVPVDPDEGATPEPTVDPCSGVNQPAGCTCILETKAYCASGVCDKGKCTDPNETKETPAPTKDPCTGRNQPAGCTCILETKAYCASGVCDKGKCTDPNTGTSTATPQPTSEPVTTPAGSAACKGKGQVQCGRTTGCEWASCASSSRCVPTGTTDPCAESNNLHQNIVGKAHAQDDASTVKAQTGDEVDPGVYSGPGGVTLNFFSPTTVAFFIDANGNGVKDEGEKEVENKSYELIKQQEAFTYEVLNGTNAMNFPFYKDDKNFYSANDIIEEARTQGVTITSIKKWYGKWIEYSKEDGKTYGKDFSIKPNEGYFVTSTITGSFGLFGSTPQESFPQQLLNGWSLVGVAPGYGSNKQEAYVHNEFANGIEAFEYITVVNKSDNSIELNNVTRYDSGVYRGVNYAEGEDGKMKEFGLDFELNAMQAYFVKSEKKTVFTP